MQKKKELSKTPWIHDMQPGIVLKKLNGKRARVEQKPSAKTIIENLVHWTVTLISKDGWRMECIFSNEKT